MKILLVRHPETSYNASSPGPELLRSWADIPLNQTGKNDSKKVANTIANEKQQPTRVYSSPLQRAFYCAQQIANAIHLTVTRAAEAKTWHLGTFAGEPVDKIKHVLAEYSTTKKSEVPPKGGESFDTFLDRWLGFLQKVGRNEQCPCGSGKKFKKCCGA